MQCSAKIYPIAMGQSPGNKASLTILE